MAEEDDLPLGARQAGGRAATRAGQRRWLEPLTLDLLGLEELEAYVTELKAEIARAEAEAARKSSHKNAAEAFFRKPG